MADSGSGPKRDGFLDKGLSWDKRLELARAERARIEAEQGSAQITPKLKPWEVDAEAEDDADPAPVQGYPGLPRERRAAVARRMRAAEETAADKSARTAPDARDGQAAVEPGPGQEETPQRLAYEDQPPPPPARSVRAITRPLVLPGLAPPDEPELDGAALAVNRLLAAPPVDRKSALYGARFDPIPERTTQRRGVLWLVVVVCILGGLLAGVLIAVGLFFALASDARTPSPQRLLALVSGNPASAALAERPEGGAAAHVTIPRQPDVAEITRAEWTSASVGRQPVSAGMMPAHAGVARTGPMTALPALHAVPVAESPPVPPQPGLAPVRALAGATLGGPFAKDAPSVPTASVPTEVVADLAVLAAPPASTPPGVPGVETRPPHDTVQVRLAALSTDAFAGPPPPLALEAMIAGPRLAPLAPSGSGWQVAAFDAPPERRETIRAAVPDAELAVSVDDLVPPAGLSSVVALVEPIAPTSVLRAGSVGTAAFAPAPAPSVPGHLGPVAPDRALACAACQPTATVAENRTVRLRLPEASNVRDRRAVGALLEEAGFDRVLPAIQALPVSASQVRYFRPEDAEAARLLADLVRADLFDLSWFSPLPPEGTIEVLIASGGLTGTLPPG
ncbi:MAG: hypothetical protein KDK24_18585 [Pseudooceanicola sp.]|nr:hypothetical protein [Pseudooceanicola sp.]